MRIQNTAYRLLIAALLGWTVSEMADPVFGSARESLVAQAEAEQEEQVSRELEVGPHGSLTLSNISGDIVVRGGSGTTIQIEATKRVENARGPEEARNLLRGVEVDISQTGDRVRVETRYREHGSRHRRGGVSVDYRVTVPVGTAVSAQSVSGDVDVEDVEGELRAEAVSGDVRVRRVKELLQAKSVSGDVEVASAGSSSNLQLGSVSGEVTATDVRATSVDIESVSGGITLTTVACERATLETVSGDIQYEGEIAPSGRYEISSHSGEVDLAISGETGFELEAESFSGEIESDFPLTVHSIQGKRNALSGVYGDGSAVIEVSTFSGDVKLRANPLR